MSGERLLYTRAARVGLDMLPVELRMHLETHLENLTLLLEATPERLPEMLDRLDDGFVTAVQGVRVLFTLDTSARSILVHGLESSPDAARGSAEAGATR